jgi:hypothetical protein
VIALGRYRRAIMNTKSNKNTVAMASMEFTWIDSFVSRSPVVALAPAVGISTCGSTSADSSLPSLSIPVAITLVGG